MHELKAEYKENGCGVEMEGDNPYLLLNLEMYCNCNGLKGLSHCDFVYVFLKGEEFQIFIVELKDMGELMKDDLESILDDIVDNKFPQTRNSILPRVLEFLNARRNTKFYGVLVLPLHQDEKLDRVYALLSRFKSKFVALKRKGFNDAWIAPCGGNIWNRVS